MVLSTRSDSLQSYQPEAIVYGPINRKAAVVSDSYWISAERAMSFGSSAERVMSFGSSVEEERIDKMLDLSARK